jgi:type I restriction enzyme M protein
MLISEYDESTAAQNVFCYDSSLAKATNHIMFEQAFKNIDDVLWKEAGCTTELDYTEQSSWLLFLKYLDDLEQDKSTEAALEGKKYTYILDKPYRWESWAAPKDKDGKLDHNKALTGDDLRDFVNGKLFPYLHSFKQKASGPNTIEYKIGEIFGEIKNKIQSGYHEASCSKSR